MDNLIEEFSDISHERLVSEVLVISALQVTLSPPLPQPSHSKNSKAAFDSEKSCVLICHYTERGGDPDNL